MNCFKIVVLLILFNLVAQAADRHVSVFYYPWYDTDRHWGEGYMRRLLIPPQHPELGHYSNRDDAVIERHLHWSQEYGIDNWICSWWGPTSWENETILDYISPNLQESGVTYCLFYESAGLLNMQDGHIDFDEQRISTFRQHFDFIAKNFFADPAYYKINGRPVVYIYLTRTFGGDYQSAIDSLRQDMRDLGYDIFLVGDEVYWGSPNLGRIASLDAITAYNMHGPQEFDGYPLETGFFEKVAEKYRTYRTFANLWGKAFIPKIMPGFNDRGVRLSADHYVIPNQVHPDSSHTSTFEHYAQLVEDFIDEKLNAVVITSFNEWHEDTQIEPTNVAAPTGQDQSANDVYTQGYSYAGYGTAYLEIVRDYFSDAETGIRDVAAAVDGARLGLKNFPNPFNNSTDIQFYVENIDCVTVRVYTLSGAAAKQINLGSQAVGWHRYHLDMSDMPSGLYFYAISIGTAKSKLHKMLLIK